MNVYDLYHNNKNNQDEFISMSEISNDIKFFQLQRNTKKLYVEPITEDHNDIIFSVNTQIDLIAAIPFSSYAFHNSEHMEIFLKPNISSSLEKSKVVIKNKIIHKYTHFLFGKINKTFDLWLIFPNAFTTSGFIIFFFNTYIFIYI